MALSPTSSHGGASFPSTWTVGTDGSLAIAPTDPTVVPLRITLPLGATTPGTDAIEILSQDVVGGTTVFFVDAYGDVSGHTDPTQNGGTSYRLLDATGSRTDFDASGWRVRLPPAKAAKVIDQSGNSITETREGGSLTLLVHSAPSDGSLAAGDCALWFDQSNGAAATKLMVKAKSADGTVKTAAIVLA